MHPPHSPASPPPQPCQSSNLQDRSSNTARAVFNLNGEAKWSLSGTPLQNRVGELYSLIRFLRAGTKL